jgi:hypothetical protein
MDYLMLIHSDETTGMPGPTDPDFEPMMAAWAAYNQRLIDGGHWIAGASLQPTATATTVTLTAGSTPAVTDGPYAETKEQLGGFYLVAADDLDAALELASAIPLPYASIEVRPVAVRPDAG